jgi:mannose-6-phosphate isomerase-like protein (cupin superfamily)
MVVPVDRTYDCTVSRLESGVRSRPEVIVPSTQQEASKMVIRGSEVETKEGRRPYPLDGLEVQVKHFVVRLTTPGNPFKPHKHERTELWFLIDGEAVVSIDGQDHAVKKGDLVTIEPWVEHGLHSDTKATWICMG